MVGVGAVEPNSEDSKNANSKSPKCQVVLALIIFQVGDDWQRLSYVVCLSVDESLSNQTTAYYPQQTTDNEKQHAVEKNEVGDDECSSNRK